MWDTVGADGTRNVTSSFLRKADGAIIAYDVTDNKSYNSIKEWIDLIEQNSKIMIAKIIVATKIDLIN